MKIISVHSLYLCSISRIMITVIFMIIVILSFISSWFGLEIYATIDNKSIEDHHKDAFLFSWFIVGFVLTFSLALSSILVKFLSPSDIADKVFLLTASCVSIVSAGCGWDLTTRNKTTNDEYGRNVYIIFTGISVIGFIYSLNVLELEIVRE